jgi:hypothetical protein
MKPKDAKETAKRVMRTVRQQRENPPVGDSLRPELQKALLDAADKLMTTKQPLVEISGELDDLLGGNWDFHGHMLLEHTAAESAIFQFICSLHSRLDELTDGN